MDSSGVFQVFEPDNQQPIYTVPTLREYFRDLDYVIKIISDGPTKSFAFRRLRYLESKFHMYGNVFLHFPASYLFKYSTSTFE